MSEAATAIAAPSSGATYIGSLSVCRSSGVICVEMQRKLGQSGARFAELGVHHFARPFGHSQFFRFGRVARPLLDVALLWVNLVLLRRAAG